MCMIGHDFCSFYRYFLYRHTEKKNQVFGESTLSVKFWFSLSRRSAEVIFNVFSIYHKKKKNLKKIVADTQIIRT